jgi:hypothetical protein
MRHDRRRIGYPLLLLGIALGGSPFQAAADEPEAMGRVTALTGHVVAERDGEPPRTLHCRDRVYRGERIVTSESARIGVLTDDVYAHLAERSALRLDRTPAESTDMTLEVGGVRVIDPRAAGSRARLAALDAAAQVAGNDAEAYIFVEKTGPYAMLCEWDAPLPVARKGEEAVADPGKCVIAKPAEPLYLASAHDERLASPGEDACPLGPVIGSLDQHLSPADVAAAPLAAPWSGVAASPTDARRNACDTPGSTCASIVVIQPPPIGGGFPGAGGGGEVN